MRICVPHDPENPEDHPALDVWVEFDEDDALTTVALFQQRGLSVISPGNDHIQLPLEHLLRIAAAVARGDE